MSSRSWIHELGSSSRSLVYETGLNRIGLKTKDDPEISILSSKGEPFVVHVKLARLKHNEEINLGTLLAFYGSLEVTPFDVSYTITTTEHSEKIESKILMMVQEPANKPPD